MNDKMSKIGAACLLTISLITPACVKNPPQMPPEKELRALALDSILAVNQAIQTKDFAELHGKISEMWRKQITQQKLAETFQTFIDQEIDLSSVSRVDPIFEKPARIDGDDVLTLEGRYPINPNKAEFRLRYVNEKGAWKLIGIKVNVVPEGTGEGKMPSEKEGIALVRDSLGNFNHAIQEKNFVDLTNRSPLAKTNHPGKAAGTFSVIHRSGDRYRTGPGA